MQTYIGTKIVDAVPVIREVGTVKVDGYKVIHPNGREDFFSKAIFEEEYHPSIGMNFGLALEAVKRGKKCRRAGWSRKNQHIELATRTIYMLSGKVYESKACVLLDDDKAQLRWSPSSADLLAEDWEIVE